MVFLSRNATAHARTVLQLGMLFVVIGLASCSEPTTDNATYKKLAAIMDEQKASWTASGGGARGVNVSGTVCPTVSTGELEDMTKDQSLSGNLDYKFYERSLTYADNTRLWTINRPISWTQKQVLMISVSPRDGCVAIYRHMN